MAHTKMPDDVRRTCIELVKGYERRVKKYQERRAQIMMGSPGRFEVIKDESDPNDWQKATHFYPPSSHSTSRTGEDRALQLLELEEQSETKRMRAVEQAKLQIGLDLPGEMRKKLTDAILMNCKGGRKYPYSCFYLPGIEKTNFYDRRTDFLCSIAEFLELL